LQLCAGGHNNPVTIFHGGIRHFFGGSRFTVLAHHSSSRMRSISAALNSAFSSASRLTISRALVDKRTLWLRNSRFNRSHCAPLASNNFCVSSLSIAIRSWPVWPRDPPGTRHGAIETPVEPEFHCHRAGNSVSGLLLR